MCRDVYTRTCMPSTFSSLHTKSYIIKPNHTLLSQNHPLFADTLTQRELVQYH